MQFIKDILKKLDTIDKFMLAIILVFFIAGIVPITTNFTEVGELKLAFWIVIIFGGIFCLFMILFFIKQIRKGKKDIPDDFDIELYKDFDTFVKLSEFSMKDIKQIINNHKSLYRLTEHNFFVVKVPGYEKDIEDIEVMIKNEDIDEIIKKGKIWAFNLIYTKLLETGIKLIKDYLSKNERAIKLENSKDFNIKSIIEVLYQIESIHKKQCDKLPDLISLKILSQFSSDFEMFMDKSKAIVKSGLNHHYKVFEILDMLIIFYDLAFSKIGMKSNMQINGTLDDAYIQIGKALLDGMIK